MEKPYLQSRRFLASICDYEELKRLIRQDEVLMIIGMLIGFGGSTWAFIASQYGLVFAIAIGIVFWAALWHWRIFRAGFYCEWFTERHATEYSYWGMFRAEMHRPYLQLLLYLCCFSPVIYMMFRSGQMLVRSGGWLLVSGMSLFFVLGFVCITVLTWLAGRDSAKAKEMLDDRLRQESSDEAGGRNDPESIGVSDRRHSA